MRRPSRLLTGCALAAAALVATSPSAYANTIAQGPPDDAASYLVDHLTDGDHYEGAFGPEYGPTIDVALGLQAAGGQDETLSRIGAFMAKPDSVAAYVHGVPFDNPDAAYAGATGKLGFFVSITGGDPRNVADEDLIALLQGLEQPDGRFTDRSDFGDFSNVLSQSYGILSLTAASDVEPSDASIQVLLDAQCDDGSFTLDFDGGDCTGTPDATGVAVQALNASDPDESGDLSPERETALIAAAQWLQDARQADGSYLLDGAVNINSTGYGGLGVLAVGQDASLTTDFLASVQRDDGGLPIAPGGESDVFATAQALPALASDSFLSLDPSVVEPAITIPGPTEPPTESPTITQTGPTETPTPTGTLPPTGGSTSQVWIFALALLGGGGLLVLAARRALARP